MESGGAVAIGISPSGHPIYVSHGDGLLFARENDAWTWARRARIELKRYEGQKEALVVEPFEYDDSQ